MIEHGSRTVSLLDALAMVGAGGAAELAALSGIGEPATRARLRRLAAEGLVGASRVLHGEPALYALTRRGLRAAGRGELDPVVVGASNAAHLAAVARVAVAWRGRGTAWPASASCGHGSARRAGRWRARRSDGRATGRLRCTAPTSCVCATGCRWRSRWS